MVVLDMETGKHNCHLVLETTGDGDFTGNFFCIYCDKKISTEKWVESVRVDMADSPVLERGAGAWIHVLLVDNDPLVRRTLKRLLQDYPDIDVIGEATTGEEAISRAGKLQPTVVVMDISMPKMDGIAATREIKAQYPDIKVLGLSQYSESYLIDAMKKAGALGVYQKENAFEELYPAIHNATVH